MPPLKFDPEATVEEIAGIGRHAAFDAVLDDKDDDTIQVVCRRADGTGIPLANPARAFYFGDRIRYTEESSATTSARSSKFSTPTPSSATSAGSTNSNAPASEAS